MLGGAATFKPQFEAYLAKLPPGQPKELREFMSHLATLTDNGTRMINPGRYKGLLENLETHSTDSPQYIRLLSVVIPSLRTELLPFMDSGQYDVLFSNHGMYCAGPKGKRGLYLYM